MNTARNRRKWRNFLIHPRFQLRLAMIHTVFVLLVVVVLVVAVLAPLYMQMQGPDDLRIRYATAQLLLGILDRIGIVLVLILVISAAYHIVFSHRLCGPLVNIGHTFDAIARGDLTRKVYLRRRDFLKDEAANINTMIIAMETRISDLKANQKGLAVAVGSLPDGEEKNRLEALLKQNEALLRQWVVSGGEEP